MSARTVLRGAVSVLSWLLLLIMGAVLVLGVVLPRAVGGQTYTVLSGSMTPAYPPGALVVTRPVTVDDLGLGDVITYQLHSGRPEVVTHRIVATTRTAAGEVQLTTKGDHNDDVDPATVVPGQVRGRVWFGVPLIGYAGRWLTGPERLVGLAIVVAILVGYATVMFVGAARESRTRRRPRRPARAATP